MSADGKEIGREPGCCGVMEGEEGVIDEGLSAVTPPIEPRVSRMTAALRALARYCRSDAPTFAGMVEQLRERGHAMLALMFSIIFLVPLGLPGLSTLLGAVIALAGVAILLARPPWLPRTLLARRVPGKAFAKVFTAAEKVLRPVEKVARPRWPLLSAQTAVHRVAGALIIICAFLLALPLPPGTNAPPAAAIVLLSIGLLEEDGLFLALGAVAAAINVALFGTLAVLGASALHHFLPF